MTRILLVLLAVFVVLSSAAVIQVRNRMSAARLGSDVTYTLDAEGNANVEMVEKTYFIDADTQKNFDGLVSRLGKPDVERFGQGIEKTVKELSERIGRSGMEVGGFDARFEENPEYGARVYNFHWTGFAAMGDGVWTIDFRKADPMKLTKDSSLTVVLPSGASLIRAEPAPEGGTETRLVWTGTGEMPWPYVEYR